MMAGSEHAMQALASAVSVATRLLVGALVVLLAVSFFRSYVVVKQHQSGQVYRFGRPLRRLGPGEHAVVFPPPIDEVRMYSVTREQLLASDALFYALTEEEKRTGTEGLVPDALRPGVDGYAVTADRNIVHCRVQLYYRVSDPIAFYELCGDGVSILEVLLHHAVFEAASSRSIEDALFALPSFSERAAQLLSASVTDLGLGVSVNRVVLKVVPPRQVRDAFDAQLAARQEADQALKEAESYRVSVLNDAEVLADRVVSEAQAERTTRVESARARGETFSTLLSQYRAIGPVMRRDLHTSAVRRVLEKAEETFLVDEGEDREVRLQLGRRPLPRGDSEQDTGTRD